MEGSAWGGSEELWSETAKELVARGVHVAASVHGSTPVHPRIQALIDRGIDVRQRSDKRSLVARVCRRLSRDTTWPPWISDIAELIAKKKPALVVISDGGIVPAVSLVELVAKNSPFATIAHNNFEYWWPHDEMVSQYQNSYAKALRCFFVSEANKSLLEKMINWQFSNAAIVRNPFNVKFDARPSWPTPSEKGELRLACVGRLDIRSKGQNLLLEALARSIWQQRDWKLTFYGDGPMKKGIENLADRLQISHRVFMAGHVKDVETVWRDNHILVQPSWHEGLPLSIVEAMLCDRPVLATNVGGNAEIMIDGITGFLADAPTSDSIAAALERAWEARPRLEQMGKNGAEHIRQIIPQDPAAVFAEQLLELIN